jgi:ketosteroid isomerase-like protein
MSLESRKQLIQTFFSTLSAGEYAEAFANVADDVVWWVPGNLPFSGNKSKAEYMAIVQRIRDGFPAGFTLTVTGVTAEGDKVAAEVVSSGTHRNGRAYNNHYHFLFRLRDGRIVEVKEYMDTLHLAQLLAP